MPAPGRPLPGYDDRGELAVEVVAQLGVLGELGEKVLQRDVELAAVQRDDLLLQPIAERIDGMKYEEQGGPALRDLVEVIRNFGDPRDVTSLLRRTTFNMAVGNADAHAKNFSILHEPGTPAINLAPLYDVLSTIALELTDRTGQPMQADTHLGQHVGGQADIREVTSANLVDEGVSWGVRRPAAAAVVAETLDRVLAAIAAIPGDARVLAIIREQAERISRS